MSQTPGFDFSQFVPGFDFLKNLQTQGAATGMGPSSWVAPTLDPQELDKRIQELKAVQFWLNQNTQAIAATIQALEVQRMTLKTLQDMNLSMGDLAQSLKAKPSAWPTGAFAFSASPDAATASATPPPAAKTSAPRAKGAKSTKTAASGAAVDPMQWWGALTQQFQHIAQKTMSDMQQQAQAAGMDMPAAAQQASTAKPTASKPSVAKPAARKRRPVKRP